MTSASSDTTPATPEVGEEQLAARLRLVIMRLHRRLRAHADADLSPTLISALATVEHHGPLTLGDLAAHERVSPPSITRAVGKLEAKGFVTRSVDEADRRVARVALTAAGRRTLQRGRSRKTAYLAKRLRALEPEESAALRAALPALERLLESEP